jgi:hypothetical protein
VQISARPGGERAKAGAAQVPGEIKAAAAETACSYRMGEAGAFLPIPLIFYSSGFVVYLML